MSVTPPPINQWYIGEIYNSNNWGSTSTSVTIAYADLHYLKFPISQSALANINKLNIYSSLSVGSTTTSDALSINGGMLCTGVHATVNSGLSFNYLPLGGINSAGLSYLLSVGTATKAGDFALYGTPTTGTPVTTLIYANGTNGNVGIATGTPAYPLDVNGTINTNTLISIPKTTLNYSTLPSLGVNDIGNQNFWTGTFTAPFSTGGATIASIVGVPIGTYLLIYTVLTSVDTVPATGNFIYVIQKNGTNIEGSYYATHSSGAVHTTSHTVYYQNNSVSATFSILASTTSGSVTTINSDGSPTSQSQFRAVRIA